MSAAPVLQIRNLDVRFLSHRSEIVAVSDLSLDIAEGEILGLVGESGSGKSMTALAALGLAPSGAVVTGSLVIDGTQVVGADRKTLQTLRGGVAAMIFQNPSAALNPFFTIREQLADIVMRHRRVTEKAAGEILVRAFADTHLADPELALNRYPHQLSGGQLQRVVIATAIACSPKLLIADEPTTALDVTVQAQIVATLQELARSRGLAILFITHDLGLVGTLCDRIGVMYAGRVVELSDLASFLAGPKHPYSDRLRAVVPELGDTGRLATIPGQVPDASGPRIGCAFAPRCDFARDVCRIEVPALSEIGSGSVACHFPLGLADHSGAEQEPAA